MNGLRRAALGGAGLVLFAAGFASGQQAAPTDFKGVRQTVLAKIDLAGEIRIVKDRDLRLTRATIAPSGHVPLHSHEGDPTIVYVLSGVLTNHQNGTVHELHPGDVLAEFGPGSHWVENRGPDPAVYLAANIHRRK
ncbi:MAG TPA: cupin domain-containing protein [Stellaceae bacterium]|nr:cupin domain-containing protein [Stellaceae bacterium]